MAEKKLLVCDDDQDILDLVQMIFESNQYKVICENNSMNIYKSIEREQPDALLMDIWMPGLSGDQVTKVLKQNAETKNIPVIMFSASEEGKKIANESGADDYISKPFDIADLLSVVNIHINKKRLT
jgi:Response regulators consisting of a CheY-like receiver domain and a winged-helix DNA-binding domain